MPSFCATNSNLQRLVSTKSLSPDRLFSVFCFLFSVFCFLFSVFCFLFSVFSLFYSMSKYAVIPTKVGI
ncbi:hypothetical protein EPM73_11985 [Neisseria gonorrhoeae]